MNIKSFLMNYKMFIRKKEIERSLIIIETDGSEKQRHQSI